MWIHVYILYAVFALGFCESAPQDTLGRRLGSINIKKKLNQNLAF